LPTTILPAVGGGDSQLSAGNTKIAADAHPPAAPARRRDYLAIDGATWRSLEIERTIRGESLEGSLLGAIDRTRTSMGARLLRQWLRSPRRDAGQIQIARRPSRLYWTRREFARDRGGAGRFLRHRAHRRPPVRQPGRPARSGGGWAAASMPRRNCSIASLRCLASRRLILNWARCVPSANRARRFSRRPSNPIPLRICAKET